MYELSATFETLKILSIMTGKVDKVKYHTERSYDSNRNYFQRLFHQRREFDEDNQTKAGREND